MPARPALPLPQHARHHAIRSVMSFILPIYYSACMICLCVFHLYTISTHGKYINAPVTQTEEIPCSCCPHTPAHTFACLYDRTWLHLYVSIHWVFVCGCVWNNDIWLWASCVDSFTLNLAWSVGQLVLYRLTPPILLMSPVYFLIRHLFSIFASLGMKEKAEIFRSHLPSDTMKSLLNTSEFFHGIRRNC